MAVIPTGMRQETETPGQDQVGYPPFDTPKPVADNVFLVDSLLPGVIGKVFAARMTVIRLSDGDLLLHSPTRFSPGLKSALEALGRIRHLVAPSFAHWQFLLPWQQVCPDAITWAAPGLRARSQPRKKGVRFDRELGDKPPPEWGGVIETVTVPGGLGFYETALFHTPSATLLLTDIVMNMERQKLPRVMRPVAWLFGMLAPDGMPPPYLRAIVKRRREAAREAALRLLDFRPTRVIFAHGRWFEEHGAAALRRSLRWLLDG